MLIIGLWIRCVLWLTTLPYELLITIIININWLIIPPTTKTEIISTFLGCLVIWLIPTYQLKLKHLVPVYPIIHATSFVPLNHTCEVLISIVITNDFLSTIITIAIIERNYDVLVSIFDGLRQMLMFLYIVGNITTFN